MVAIMISRRTLPIVAILAVLVLPPNALRAQPFGTPQEANDAILVGMAIIEVPSQVSQKFGLAERLADLGLVLSDAEAKKLTEAGQNAPGCNVVQVPSVRTAIGRSTVVNGSIRDRRIACLVLPESAGSNGEITLRIAPLPAARSPAEIAAGDHAALFALTRTSATVHLNKNESMMLGGWKTGKDDSSTLMVIVKPQVAAEPSAALAAQSHSSTMSMMSMVDPRIIIGEGEEERLGVVREVPTAQKPVAAASAPRPRAPAPLPRSGPPGEGGSQQILLAVKLMELDEKKLKDSGSALSSLRSSLEIRPADGDLPVVFAILDDSEARSLVEGVRKGQLGRVLAEPTLVTLSGRPANFSVGGEIPVWSEGMDGKSVQRWERYATEATFRPQVLDDGRLRLNLGIGCSEVDRTKTEITGKDIRRRCIETTCDLRPGQVLVAGSRSATPSAAEKEPHGPTVLLLVTPQIVDSMAAIPSPDNVRPRAADAMR